MALSAAIGQNRTRCAGTMGHDAPGAGKPRPIAAHTRRPRAGRIRPRADRGQHQRSRLLTNLSGGLADRLSGCRARPTFDMHACGNGASTQKDSVPDLALCVLGVPTLRPANIG